VNEQIFPLVQLLDAPMAPRCPVAGRDVQRRAGIHDNQVKTQKGEKAMKPELRLATAGALLLAATMTSALAEPVKELDVYKSGLGKFNCEAKETGSGKMFKAMVVKTVEFDGHTFVEHYVESKSADHPSPWSAIFIMSYDPAAKRWVRNGVDNSGERNAASSSGWKGDTWVWENDGVNIVIDRKSGGDFTFAVDVKQANGVKRVVQAMCKKV
jgi:hypothetical protein